MRIERLRGLLRPIINQFTDYTDIPVDGAPSIRVGIRLPSAADEAEVSAGVSETTSEILQEIQKIMVIKNGQPEARFDPSLYPIVTEKVNASMAQIRSQRQLYVLSYAVFSIAGDEIPEWVEDSGGQKIERHQAVFDVLRELPDEAITHLFGVYRALLIKAEATFAKSRVDGTLDAEIEMAEANLDQLKARKAEETRVLRQQVEEVAVTARVPDKPSAENSDIPDGASFTLDDSEDVREVSRHTPRPPNPPEPEPAQQSAEHTIPSTESAPSADSMSRVPLSTTAEISYIEEGNDRIPVHETDADTGVLSLKTTPVQSPIPAPTKQSVNPHWRPKSALRGPRR